MTGSDVLELGEHADAAAGATRAGLEVDALPAPLYADGVRIRQVLIGLFTGAALDPLALGRR